MTKRIAIYGGSFDPPHLGHINAAKQVLKETSFLNELWFMPAGKHPWRQCEAPGKDRYNMVMCATKNLPKTTTSNHEIEKGKANYTIDTIKDLRKKHPNNTWCLIIGADNITTLHKWERYQHLLHMVTLVVVPRAGFSFSESLPTGTIVIKDPQNTIPQVSSSKVRRLVREGRSIKSLTHPCIAEYIKSHKLYL